MLIFALVVVGLCTWSAIAPAQFAIGVGGWDSGYHASTAAEGALTGMANAISAQGQYNLSTSEAAINMEEAQRRDIENRGKWTETYFEMRRTNKAYQDSLKKPRDPEAALRYAQAQKPKRLTLSELGVSGDIHWPAKLSADKYADERQELDKLFTERAQKGSLSAKEASQVRDTTRAMLDDLKADIDSMAPADYTKSKQFIVSLSYEASMPVN
jgi:hypothetical protein